MKPNRLWQPVFGRLFAFTFLLIVLIGVLALVVMVMVSLTACGAATKSGDAAAMPASSGHLKGEDYQDVVISLRSAGFTDVTTATIDDHTLPKEATDSAKESSSATTGTPDSVERTTTSTEVTTTTSTEATTTTAGVGLELTVVDVRSPVSPGSSATVKVKTAPGADCYIAVEYKSGRSKAKGLDPKKADAAGDVSWTWVVGPNTSSGQYPITVTASMDGQSATQITTFVVK